MVNECVKKILKEYRGSYRDRADATKILSVYSEEFIQHIFNDDVKRQMEEEEGPIYEMVTQIFKPEYKLHIHCEMWGSKGNYDEPPYDDSEIEITDDSGLWMDIQKISNESIKNIFEKAYESYEESLGDDDAIDWNYYDEDEGEWPKKNF